MTPIAPGLLLAAAKTSSASENAPAANAEGFQNLVDAKTSQGQEHHEKSNDAAQETKEQQEITAPKDVVPDEKKSAPSKDAEDAKPVVIKVGVPQRPAAPKVETPASGSQAKNSTESSANLEQKLSVATAPVTKPEASREPKAAETTHIASTAGAPEVTKSETMTLAGPVQDQPKATASEQSKSVTQVQEPAQSTKPFEQISGVAAQKQIKIAEQSVQEASPIEGPSLEEAETASASNDIVMNVAEAETHRQPVASDDAISPQTPGVEQGSFVRPEVLSSPFQTQSQESPPIEQPNKTSAPTQKVLGDAVKTSAPGEASDDLISPDVSLPDQAETEEAQTQITISPSSLSVMAEMAKEQAPAPVAEEAIARAKDASASVKVPSSEVSSAPQAQQAAAPVVPSGDLTSDHTPDPKVIVTEPKTSSPTHNQSAEVQPDVKPTATASLEGQAPQGVLVTEVKRAIQVEKPQPDAQDAPKQDRGSKVEVSLSKPEQVASTPLRTSAPEFSLDGIKIPSDMMEIQPTTATPKAAPKSPIVQNVLSQIQSANIEPGKVTVKLRPDGLGIIELEIAQDKDGLMEVALRAKNPMVLDALRMERHVISDLLSQQGAQLRQEGLSFDLFGQNGKAGGETTKGNQGSSSAASADQTQDEAHKDEVTSERPKEQRQSATNILI